MTTQTNPANLPDEKEDIHLDVKDRKILFELSINARFSLTRIAKNVGLSREVVDYRIKSLIKRNILSGFITQINPAKLGMVGHIIYMQLKDPTEETENEVISYLINHQKTVWVACCLGRWQVGFSILSQNNEEFGAVFDEIISSLCDNVKEHIILTGLREGRLPYYHLVEGLDYKQKKQQERKDNSFQKQLLETKESIPAKLDATDQKILSILAADARIELLELGKQVSLSSGSVYNRIEKLIRMGIITAFIPLISFHVLGLEWFMTFINFKNITPKLENGLLTEIYYHSYVLWYVKCLGQMNLQLSVFAKDSSHYNKTMKGILAKFKDSALSYDFVIVTKQLKFIY